MINRIAPVIALTLFAAPMAVAQTTDGSGDAFLDFDDEAVLDERACGNTAEEWLNTTMVDLDDTWTLALREPLDGQDAFTLRLDATQDGGPTVGGGLFASVVPLESAAGGGRPFEQLGLDDVDISNMEEVIGCAIEDLPRLSARGARMEPSDQESVLLRLVVASPRLMIGSVQLGVGDDADTRMVRVTR
jgi:hypothetical protein